MQGVVAVISSVAERKEEIQRLCLRYSVQYLALFGSAATGSYDPEKSDLDFVVEFRKMEPGEYADAYFGLLESLQDLFKSPVNLVVGSAIKNPYFLRSVESTKTPLYEA